jgi:hypothetical protein
MLSTKPLASLSLDLDNRWSYLKTHGDAGWASFPTYLPTMVPRVLEFLARRRLTITFFVVGQDAVREENREAIAAIAAAGHEIGNHSFHHEPWLQLYTEAEIEAEIEQAEAALAAVTGQRPTGFRGPGFSCSLPTLRVLARRGYQYDASTLPTFLGPLARAYFFATAKLNCEEKRQRAALFGKFTEGFRSIRPYRWRTEQGSLLEIPVTTMPVFKTPIHFSYLLYLSTYSPLAAESYFRLALGLCRMTGTQPSLLLHPLDFLGLDDAPDLAFFPAMHLPIDVKLHRVSRFLELFAAQFQVVPMHVHAASCLAEVDPELLPVGLEA